MTRLGVLAALFAAGLVAFLDVSAPLRQFAGLESAALTLHARPSRAVSYELAYFVVLDIQNAPNGDEAPESTAVRLITAARPYLGDSVFMQYATEDQITQECAAVQTTSGCDVIRVIERVDQVNSRVLDARAQIARLGDDGKMHAEQVVPVDRPGCENSDLPAPWRMCRKALFKMFAPDLQSHYRKHLAPQVP